MGQYSLIVYDHRGAMIKVLVPPYSTDCRQDGAGVGVTVGWTSASEPGASDTARWCVTTYPSGSSAFLLMSCSQATPLIRP
jgi:hypothetical protein